MNNWIVLDSDVCTYAAYIHFITNPNSVLIFNLIMRNHENNLNWNWMYYCLDTIYLHYIQFLSNARLFVADCNAMQWIMLQLMLWCGKSRTRKLKNLPLSFWEVFSIYWSWDEKSEMTRETNLITGNMWLIWSICAIHVSTVFDVVCWTIVFPENRSSASGF